jgi:hypothetical protein
MAFDGFFIEQSGVPTRLFAGFFLNSFHLGSLS